MTLGRPKEFDRTEALEKAMKVFWAKGYEAASVSDLLEGMGINRGSLYDTYGDKRSLFIEAFGHYRQNVAGPLMDMLHATGSPLANIRRTLLRAAKVAASNGCRGCLLTNTAVEIAPHDAEIAKVIKSTLLGVEAAFRQTLDNAVKLGELSSKADTRALARFLVSTLQGLVVLSKGKLSSGTRDDVIKVTMAALAA